MADFDKEELLKLKPEERLKKLKELEEKEKKEAEEISSLIKRSQEEIKNSKIEVDVPPITPVDITHLFETESGIDGAVQNVPPVADFDVVSYAPSINLEGYRQIAGFAPRDDIKLDLAFQKNTYKTLDEINLDTVGSRAITRLKEYGIK